MPDWKLEIATQWVGSGIDEDSNRPLFGDEYTFIRWTDKTAQVMNQSGKRPKMNSYIVEAEETEAVYNSLDNDNSYLVFTAEGIEDTLPNNENKPKDGEPTQRELASWRTFFINQRPPDIEQPDWVDEVNSVLGEDVNERTRTEIMTDVIEWMKGFELV